jgi:hypothetical protein
VRHFRNDTDNIAENPAGGQSAGFTYSDNITFGLDLDLETVIGWKDAQMGVVFGHPPSMGVLRQDDRGKKIALHFRLSFDDVWRAALDLAHAEHVR